MTYGVFNHALYGIDVVYNICSTSGSSNIGSVSSPRIIAINLNENPFSFEEQSYNLNYNCLDLSIIDINNGCITYNESFLGAINVGSFNKSSTTFNTSLGWISSSSTFEDIRSGDGSSRKIRLINYIKGNKTFKPDVKEEYSIYDPPVYLEDCKNYFYPYLTPDSLQNIPMEINCKIEIWNFPYTVIVRDAGEGVCDLSNLEIDIRDCSDEDNFNISARFDFIYERDLNFVAELNGTVLDTFHYKSYYQNRFLHIYAGAYRNCFEVIEPESWELTITDLEFPECSVSKILLFLMAN